MKENKVIVSEKKWLKSISGKIEEVCEICHVGSDPTRLKILYLLKKHKELCVTDLSEILGIGISAVSHQLSLLERCKMVSKIRAGKHMCYSLGEQSNNFFDNK